MNVQLSASLLHPLTAGEMPQLAVKIVPTAALDATRRNFHLALLFDTSGSMQGVRINAVRRTMHLLIDAIALGDFMSIIEYNSTGKILANGVCIGEETRTTLHGIVDRLEADGGTNLSDALEKLRMVSGVSVGAGASGDEHVQPPVDSVFIMTDGHINSGVSSISGLTLMLNSAIISGTPVNTLGYGEQHNSSLLRSMAVYSRGSYTFADMDEMLPAIIGDILGGLNNEVGRKAILTIPQGWKCKELGADDDKYSIGTLIADKIQWIVLEGPANCSTLPTIRLTWSAGTREFVEDCLVDESIPSIEVDEQIARCSTVVVFSEVYKMLERNDVHAARIALEGLQHELIESSASESTLVIRLRAQIEDMIQSLQIPVFPAGLPGAIGGGGAPMASPALLTRLASNMTAIGVQRGFFNTRTTQTAQSVGDPITFDLEATFSSPAQRSATATIVRDFSQGVP